MQKYHILAVDDQATILTSLRQTLELKGYSVETFINPFDAQEMLYKHRYDCILLDVAMPGLDGIRLLEEILNLEQSPPVIMVSEVATIETAVTAIKLGAYDFIEKPIDPERLLLAIRNAIQTRVLLQEKQQLSHELENNYRIIGESPALQKLFVTVRTVAETDAKVLITGESGTGKELVARALFLNSPRKSKPFVCVNCAAIPSDLLEMELFGHTKGAFTGAHTDHKGKFLQADGGTIFLDEIGDMEQRLQAKILRVLQDNEVQRLGDAQTYKVNTRVITATNRDLKELVQQGAFRDDLYHRLNVVNIHIPPLRQRPEDIIPLIEHYLLKYAAEFNKPVTGLSLQAKAYLENYTWPGNVRELRNVVQKLVIFSRGTDIRLTDVQQAFDTHNGSPSNGKTPNTREANGDLKSILEYHEKQHIMQVLDEYNGHLNKTAKALGIDRITLYKKRQKYGI